MMTGGEFSLVQNNLEHLFTVDENKAANKDAVFLEALIDIRDLLAKIENHLSAHGNAGK